VLGDPVGASAAEGERLLGHLADGLTAAMDRFLAASAGSAGTPGSAGSAGTPGRPA
jgi:hypothetical protein